MSTRTSRFRQVDRVTGQECSGFPVRPTPTSATWAFDEPAEALDWLDAERANLVAAARHGATHGPRRLGRQKAAVSCHGDARDLAREIGYRPGEISALTGLASARLALGEVDDAATQAGQALSLARTAGFRLLRADALTMLATVASARGRDDEADRYADEVRTIDRETGYSLR